MKHRFFTLLLAVMASVGISNAAITVRLNPESCAGWSSVHLWAWYANGNVFDEWPGPEIYTDADGWYSYTFDASISLVNIIWNDGSSNQTVDITNITQSTCYALNSTSGSKISVSEVDCPGVNTQCGDNLTWTLDENGVLTISGTGNMYDFNLTPYNVTGWSTDYESDVPWDRTKVRTVIIGNGVTNIGKNAFNMQYRMSYGATGGHAIYYSGPESVIIPTTVTRIEGGAFQGCQYLTISIPGTVSYIGNNAFADGIEWDVYVPSFDYWYDTCLSNGKNPFHISTSSEAVISIPKPTYKLYINGELLTDLEVPESVSIIPSESFAGCISLKSITFPESVWTIESDAFSGCSSVDTITCYAQNPPEVYYGALDGISYSTVVRVPARYMSYYQSHEVWGRYDVRSLENGSASEPILSGQCGDNVYFSIDTTTMSIAFYGMGAMWKDWSDIWVRFPVPGEDYYAHHEGGTLDPDDGSHMTSASLFTFLREWCTSIEIASDKIYPLPTEGKEFAGKELESFIVSEGNSYYSSEDGVLFDKNKEVLYIYPTHKENAAYHIPNTVKRIDTEAFVLNPFITSITMGNNVEVIGMAAFVQCASLNSITLSENLSFIGYSLLELTPYYDNEANWDNGSLYIGNYLIEVARICMREATSYQNDQGEWVTETTDCPPVEIDSNYVVKEGTRLIAMFAGASDEFGDPNWLKKVTIPSSVEYVNFGAFMDNYALEEIVWNAKHCHDFEKTIPYCDYCADMTIENPFAQFADGAFEMEQEGGTQPTEMPTKKISFGKGVEYIPAGFCKDMKLLETVYNYNPDPIAVSADMFANVPYTCILYVPYGCRAKYENAPVWKDFFRIREMDQDEAIEDIYFEDATPHKVMMNGQFYIFRGDKTYTLQGQEVK